MWLLWEFVISVIIIDIIIMASVAAKAGKAGGFLKLICSQLQPRLHQDVWKSTVKYLQASCKEIDEPPTLLKDCEEAKRSRNY